MNRFLQYFFLFLLPFYPIWEWMCYTATKKPLSVFVGATLILVIIYTIIVRQLKIPKYLVFLILFTIYHLISIYINDLIPPGNLFFSILADQYVFACILFIVIESMTFEEFFINRMNPFIFTIVIISFMVSVIQIKYPTFFVTPKISSDLEGLTYLFVDNRNFSIYSWVNLNSLGITFPILISILLSMYTSKRSRIPLIMLMAFVVSFLSRARYIMISTIIVISQLFFNAKIELRKKVSTLVLIGTLLVGLILFAGLYGFDIQQVINKRILEKDTEMQSARARITSYEVFMLKFPEHPWVGVGPETRADALRLLDGIPIIHVGYLSQLYFYGLFGCLLLFLSIFFLLRDAWLAGKKYTYWASFYGLLGFCFANLTFVYFNLSEAGIVLAVIYVKYFNDQAKTELAELETA